MPENTQDPELRITTTGELLKAVELGIVDKTEARAMLGLPVKRGRLAKVQPRQGGRFAKGGLVYPLNRFTSTAQQALVEAQRFASGKGRGHIETGDMLLALLRQADGAALRVLEDIGLRENEVSTKLAQVARKEDVLEEGIGPTAQLKAVVEAAFHGVGYPQQVGTWQLILAVASRDGRARDALAELGVTEEALLARAEHIGTDDGPA